MKKTVVIGITGGIAAVKVFDLIKKITTQNINIELIVSPAASNIIEVSELEKLINKKVYTSLFSNKINIKEILEKRKVEHIQLADSANIIVIAPATANIIAKLANGIVDDYLTTVVLAATCPIIVCPSMNVHMWQHPVTKKNIQALRLMGYIVVDPDSGLLACGYEGQGRLAAINVITKEITKQINKAESLLGKKFIITAGGTKEPIDDVRFITNRSSGKMGSALAESIFLRGGEVLYVCSKTAFRPRYNVRTIEFETADELEKILKIEIINTDYIFHAAAVSDFSVKKQKGKISGNTAITLTLTPREKIVNNIKKWNTNIKLIAFKAEANVSQKEIIKKAKNKLKTSSADFIIANDVSKKDQGFEVDTNEVIIVSKSKAIKIPLATKAEIAGKILDLTIQ